MADLVEFIFKLYYWAIVCKHSMNYIRCILLVTNTTSSAYALYHKVLISSILNLLLSCCMKSSKYILNSAGDIGLP